MARTGGTGGGTPQPRKPTCKGCGHEIPAGEVDNTCGNCGFKLRTNCPKAGCGVENYNRKFCKDCGTDLTSTAKKTPRINLVVSAHVDLGKGLIRLQAIDNGKAATASIPIVCAAKGKTGAFHDLRAVPGHGLGEGAFWSNPAVRIPATAVRTEIIPTNTAGLLVIDVDFIEKFLELEFSAQGSDEKASTIPLKGPARGLPAPRGGWFRSALAGVFHSKTYHGK